MTSPTFDEWITQHLDAWWTGLSPATREDLTGATEADALDRAIVTILIETRCPIGPIGTKWEHDTEYSWTWNERVRDYITDQKTLRSMK